MFKFSTKAFDVAVIGGGPGGIAFFIQDMWLPLRLLSLVLIQFALRREVAWAGPA